MDTFLRFLYEFLFQFFGGIFSIFKGFGSGIKGMFNIKAYVKIINFFEFSIDRKIKTKCRIYLTTNALLIIQFIYKQKVTR